MFKNSLMFIIGAGLAVLLTAAVWPTLAQRAPQEPIPSPIHTRNFVNDGTVPYMVPAAAFTPDGQDPSSYHFDFFGGYLAGNAQSYGCMQAPVYLPAGVIPTAMFVSTYDNDDSEEIVVGFRRNDLATGNSTLLTEISTAGLASESSIRVGSADLVNLPITTSEDTFYVTTCLGSDAVRLYSVRIHYSSKFIYLPLILRP